MFKGDIILVYNPMLGGHVIMEITSEQEGLRPYRAVIVDAEAEGWRQDAKGFQPSYPLSWYVDIKDVVEILEEA